MLFIAVHCINAGRSKANHRKELKTWKRGSEREKKSESVSDNESGRRGEAQQ